VFITAGPITVVTNNIAQKKSKRKYTPLQPTWAPGQGMAGGGWQSESMKNLMKQLGMDPVVHEESEESRSQVPALFSSNLWNRV
jgi:hypothetical protein